MMVKYCKNGEIWKTMILHLKYETQNLSKIAIISRKYDAACKELQSLRYSSSQEMWFIWINLKFAKITYKLLLK